MIPRRFDEWTPHAGIEARLIAELGHRRVALLLVESEAGEAAALGESVDVNPLQEDAGERAVRQRTLDEIVARL